MTSRGWARIWAAIVLVASRAAFAAFRLHYDDCASYLAFAVSRSAFAAACFSLIHVSTLTGLPSVAALFPSEGTRRKAQRCTKGANLT